MIPNPPTAPTPKGSPAAPVPTTEVLDAHASILRRKDTTQLEAGHSQQVPLFQHIFLVNGSPKHVFLGLGQHRHCI